MLKEIELKLLPAEAVDEGLIKRKVAQKCRLNADQIVAIKPTRRSIDARGRRPFVRLRVQAFVGEDIPAEPALLKQLKEVHHSPSVIVVGAGPAG